MSRGGSRLGSGRKPKWIHCGTTTIRVPKIFVKQILAFAEQMDKGDMTYSAGFLDFATKPKKPVENATKSIERVERVIDLSGVRVSRLEGKTLVFLSDLVKAGYKIEPEVLSNVVQSEKK